MKLFYTDPLIAGYMAREFGIRFDLYKGGTLVIKGDVWSVEGECTFYVDPDQHQLFKVIDGDVVEFKGVSVPDLRPLDYSLVSEGDVYANEQHWSVDKEIHNVKIIMRDGKHFFMPEVEE